MAKRPKYAVHEDPDYVKHMNRLEKKRNGIKPGHRPEKVHPLMVKYLSFMRDGHENRAVNGGSQPNRKLPRALHNNPEDNKRGRTRLRRQSVYDKKKQQIKVITHNNR